MNRGVHLALGVALVFAAAPSGIPAATASRAARPYINVALVQQPRRNSITGHIFGDSRRPLSDVFIELLDDLGVTINRTRTNASGRYEFTGLPEGRFRVRALPYGTGYAEQAQEVIIANVSARGGGTGSEIQQKDFYLRLRPEFSAGPFASPGTIFVQEVPEAAKKLYEKGIGELRAKKEKEGFESLRQALAAFPDYFLALDRLGTEYAVRGNTNPAYFEAARVLLTKAVGVNAGSFSSTFGLGFAQYHLGMTDGAVENFQRAVKLYDKSVNGHLWLGVALKKLGKLSQAEASLTRANKVSNGKVAEVHLRLAEVYSEQKRYKEAADELELFLKNQQDARDAEKIRQLITQLREKAGGR